VRVFKRLLYEIESDHRSGAVVLTLKAGEALLSFARELESELPEHAHKLLEEFARRLVQAQPAMASIRNLTAKVLQVVNESGLSALPRAVEEFSRALTASTAEIARHASKLIREGARVMTISHSSTVLEAFKTAREQGRSFTVICPESRPLLEGVKLARDLGEMGISVELCADALAPSLVGVCDIVIVGGDVLAPQGLINKIGTYPLALAAHAASVPFVALIGSQKLLAHFDLEWIPEMDPRELCAEPPANVKILNRYFDLTPLEYLTEIVTERGIYDTEELGEVWPQ